MKTLFGTPVVSDVHELLEVFNELQSSQTGIINSISKQVKYMKQLDALKGVDSGAKANLSSVIEDVVIHSYDKFREVTRDIVWLIVIIHNHGNSAVRIRSVAVDPATKRTDGFHKIHTFRRVTSKPPQLNSTQLNSTTLYNILRNVSLHLPEGYELLAGTRAENIHLFYEVQVAVIGEAHCIKLI